METSDVAAFYRLFFEKNPLPMWVVDLESLSFLKVNDAAVRKYGYSREEFLGMTVREIRPAEDMPRFMAYSARSREGWDDAGRWRHVLKDGGIIDVDVTTYEIDYRGRPARIGVIHDVTATVRTEAVTRLQSAALNAAANAIVITDTAGVLTWANRAFTRLTGYSVEEAFGRTMRDLLKSGQHNREVYREMWDTILSGGIWHGELTNRRKDGVLYTERQTITPIRDSSGEITHFIAVKHDITERLKLEENLREMQKMEGIGTLASGLAHDFNNLLGVIEGYAGQIREHCADPPSVRREAEAISAAGRRGAGLLRQLMTFARKTEPDLKPLCLNNLIDDAMVLLTGVLPKTIRVATELDPGIPAIEADANQLHQVLLNLCMNARDAIGDKGELTVVTQRVPSEEVARRFERVQPADYVMLRVMDNGCGMDSSVRERIFEPFFTTKQSDKGTGLGLPVVFGIVREHNGFIDVVSEAGEGSEFRLYFPVGDRAVEKPPRRAGEKRGEAPRGTETILVVEDEEMLAGLVETVLSEHGYTVLKATDGLGAFDLFQRRRHEIAAVITDLGLPNQSGLELCLQMREVDRAVRVIVATGTLEPSLKRRLGKAGVRHVIPKPYEMRELLDLVRTVLDEER